jgi:PEP-CTERM motif
MPAGVSKVARAHWSFLHACLCAAVALGAGSVEAQTIWSGFDKSFTKPSFTDGTLPENQDLLTSNVIFARSNSSGLYNAASEDFYTQQFSPAGTTWATALMSENDGLGIEATNWQALTFTNWVDAFGGPNTFALPSSLADHNAVVFLEDDNIYLDIQFTDWGGNGDGGFSYMRAEPPAPTTTGDYNGNHVVDAADYTIWRDTFGQNADPHGSGADGIADGIIDEQDYAFWKLHFGETVPGGSGSLSASSVPEPASWLLLLGAALVLSCARK